MLNRQKSLLGIFFLALISISFSYANVDIQNNLGADVTAKHVPGEILVKFKEDKINMSSKTSIQQIRTLSLSNDVAIQEKLPESNMVLVKVDPGQDLDAQITQLESNSNVEYAEPNYIYDTQSLSAPNDTYFGLQWGYSKIGWSNAMQTIGTVPLQGTGLIVAVIDVGVDYTHPDLVNNMWDGSSCVSDTGAVLGGCQHGYDFIDNDKYPLPTTSTHGTHVAGIIAATVDNSIGIAGANPYAKIMALRAGDRVGLTSDAIIKSINFAKNNGARIINASFGGAGNSDGILQAIQSFQSVGGLFITAAGNAGTSHDIVHNYPCDYNIDNIICVGSSSSFDTLSSFSDRSSNYVDVVAPGENIASTAVVINQSTGLFEDFENTGSVFSNRIKQGAINERGLVNRGAPFNNVLATNTTSPYAANNTSSVDKTVSLSGADGAELTFDIGCDTEYSTTAWTDYILVQFSSDGGSTFTDQFQLDEPAIDQLNGAASDSAGTAIYTGFLRDIKSAYLKSGFVMRFQWVTNNTDNNHSGCFIDNVNIQKYKNTGASYAYMNGTSMSTPFVVGLASLASAYYPEATAAQIKNAIMYSGDILASLQGKIVAGTRVNFNNTLLAFKNIIPTLVSVHISSNNANSQYAKAGDTVTVSLTGSQNLSGVSIKINGQNATISGSNTHREGTIVDTGSMGEGQANIAIDYQSLLGTQGITKTGSTDASMVIFDHLGPVISILNGSGYVTGSSIILNVTGSDANGINAIILNGTTYSGGNNRNANISLSPGINSVNITGIDNLGNSSIFTTQIIRVPYTYSGTLRDIDANTVNVAFSSDFSGTGFVSYSAPGSAGTIAGIETTSHNITLSGLLSNVVYTYQTYVVYQGYTGIITTGTFKTPDVFDILSTGDKATTGSLFLIGSTTTGLVFSNPATITIHSDIGNSDVTMITNGLQIITKGYRDGIIHGPVQIAFVGIAPSLPNYTHIPSLTFEIGSTTTSLVFSGTTGVVYPRVNLGVGTSYNDKTLKVFRSDNSLNYSYISDCKVANGICSFTTNSFSTFTILAPNPSTPASGGGSAGGAGGAAPVSTVQTITNTGILPTAQLSETMSAYLFAFKNNITTQTTIEKADMNGSLIRAHLAKMISNYAINVLGKKPNTALACSFKDTDDTPKEMQSYIKTACQLGLMGKDTNVFTPNSIVTRAQFGTILSRLLYGSTNEGGSPYYTKHLSALHQKGIIKSIDPNLKEARGYVMLMLMRSQISK